VQRRHPNTVIPAEAEIKAVTSDIEIEEATPELF
jgi:hypothetical protein